VTPTELDWSEVPPFTQQPSSEFSRGIFHAVEKQSQLHYARRVQRRTAFLTSEAPIWQSVRLSTAELQRAHYFTTPLARDHAKQTNPSARIRRVSGGEAECAAVAVTRGWVLWTDDNAIVHLISSLFPGHPVERISDMLIRAVHQGLIACRDAVDLYNNVFKGSLSLWSSLTARCCNGQSVCL
jgi:hypothetical protein